MMPLEYLVLSIAYFVGISDMIIVQLDLFF